MRRRFVIGGLMAVFLATFLLNARLEAVSVGISASPNPFYFGDDVNVTAWIDPGSDDPADWCFSYDGCYVGEEYAWVSISASDGFQAFGDSYSGSASASDSDPAPGENMETTTYWADGEVDWHIWECPPGEPCYDYPYSASNSSSTSVQPDPCWPHPSGETTFAAGYIATTPTLAVYQQVLVPDTVGFGGRSVHEWTDPPGGGYDSCWFLGSPYDQQTSVSNSTWTVAGDNSWFPDAVGWTPDPIQYYRSQGRAIPDCGFQIPQTMGISCGSPPSSWSPYQSNMLESRFDYNTKVWSVRAGVYQERPW
jgi:hypothetical protein